MSSARVAGGGGTSLRAALYELRPRLGLRPWLAFFLRARIVAFFVRFDIRLTTLSARQGPSPVDERAGSLEWLLAHHKARYAGAEVAPSDPDGPDLVAYATQLLLLTFPQALQQRPRSPGGCWPRR